MPNHDRNRNGGDSDWLAARRNFEAIWLPSRWRLAVPRVPEPPVADLLDVDREFTAQMRERPPHDHGAALRSERDHRHYVARPLPLNRGDGSDPVIVFVDGSTPGRHYTVYTAKTGPAGGRRVVRGREGECLELYRAG